MPPSDPDLNMSPRDPRTLDVLWEQAEKYGQVKVEQAYSGDYDSSISISTSKGSSIWARGKSKTSAKESLLRAISEAELLVAGYLASGGVLKS